MMGDRLEGQSGADVHLCSRRSVEGAILLDPSPDLVDPMYRKQSVAVDAELGPVDEVVAAGYARGGLDQRLYGHRLEKGLQAERTGAHGVSETVLQAVERPSGMLGGARRPRLVEVVGWPPGRYLPARRNSCAGIIGVEVGGGARRAGIEKGIVALLVGVDMRTLGAAMGFAARARGHEQASRGNRVEAEVGRATLNDPEVVPWLILRSSVCELEELGPSLEHPLCDGSARTCAAFERVLCGDSAHICAGFEHVLGGGSARICAAFEHVLLKRTNYRDQASQNLELVLIGTVDRGEAHVGPVASVRRPVSPVRPESANLLDLPQVRASAVTMPASERLNGAGGGAAVAEWDVGESAAGGGRGRGALSRFRKGSAERGSDLKAGEELRGSVGMPRAVKGAQSTSAGGGGEGRHKGRVC